MRAATILENMEINYNGGNSVRKCACYLIHKSTAVWESFGDA
jgi:hypothetical protein